MYNISSYHDAIRVYNRYDILQLAGRAREYVYDVNSYAVEIPSPYQVDGYEHYEHVYLQFGHMKRYASMLAWGRIYQRGDPFEFDTYI